MIGPVPDFFSYLAPFATLFVGMLLLLWRIEKGATFSDRPFFDRDVCFIAQGIHD